VRPLQPEVAYAVFAVFGSFMPQKPEVAYAVSAVLFKTKNHPEGWL